MKKFFKDLLLNIRIIICPWYWLSNYSTNKIWDRKLNQMLDNPEFEYYSEYRVKLNGVYVWIKNFPYSYGFPTREDWIALSDSRALPSRKTRIRLKKAVDNYLSEYLLNDVLKGSED